MTEAIILATYTFQWLYANVFVFTVYSVLGTSLLLWIYAPIYSYYCPYKHYPLPMCFKCLYILPLYILCIYSFMYWKSGTSDLLVLMFFVLQCTDYKYFFYSYSYSTGMAHDSCFTWRNISPRLAFVIFIFGDQARRHIGAIHRSLRKIEGTMATISHWLVHTLLQSCLSNFRTIGQNIHIVYRSYLFVCSRSTKTKWFLPSSPSDLIDLISGQFPSDSPHFQFMGKLQTWNLMCFKNCPLWNTVKGDA